VLDTPEPSLPQNAVTTAAAPRPYDAPLKARVAANVTPEREFENTYKARRLAEFAAEYARTDAHREANPSPRLTAAEAAEFHERYRAPDPYAAGLKALRAKEKR
jgi:hypothetical protein